MSQINRITWIEPYYDIILNMIPKDIDTILDVGAGSGIFGFILKKTRNAHVTAIEPFDYNTSHYDQSYQMTWKQFYKYYTKQFDCIVSTEMIEHLSTIDAHMFLADARNISKKVIVSTPYKFEQQPAYDRNPLQTHRSLITVDDFEQYGYKVNYICIVNLRGMTLRIFAHKKTIPFLKIFGIKPVNIIGIFGD